MNNSINIQKILLDNCIFYFCNASDLGYTTRSGKKIEGSHFLKFALTQHYDEIKDAILEELSKGINQAIGDKG
jgi:Zn-finger protein